MLRKILAVVVLLIGACGVLMGLIGLPISMTKQAAPDMFAPASVLLFVGGVLVWIGAKLWGWERRRMVVGVVATAIAGQMVVVGCGALLSLHRSAAGSAMESFAWATVLSGLVFGSVLLVVGILMIRSQVARDRRGEGSKPGAGSLSLGV
jgi:hypothetical protein